MVLLQRRKEDNLLKENVAETLSFFFFRKFEQVKNHFMMVGTPVNRSQ